MLIVCGSSSLWCWRLVCAIFLFLLCFSVLSFLDIFQICDSLVTFQVESMDWIIQCLGKFIQNNNKVWVFSIHLSKLMASQKLLSVLHNQWGNLCLSYLHYVRSILLVMFDLLFLASMSFLVFCFVFVYEKCGLFVTHDCKTDLMNTNICSVWKNLKKISIIIVVCSYVFVIGFSVWQQELEKSWNDTLLYNLHGNRNHAIIYHDMSMLCYGCMHISYMCMNCVDAVMVSPFFKLIFPSTPD